MKLKKIKKLLPFPIESDCSAYSMILSTHDDQSNAFTPTLFNIVMQAIKRASEIDLSHLSKRLEQPPYYPDIWPGEHYKLLAGLVNTINPKLVVEIGTATGLSALALMENLSKDSELHTFDLFSWKEDEKTVLNDHDFEDGRLIQHVADLANENSFMQSKPILEKAELVFIDVTHDGILEKRLLDLFSKIKMPKNCYFVFDDIRFWTMLKVWREIVHKKMDLTSFGHWSGTGIVEWN